jgi:hypothetical protein
MPAAALGVSLAVFVLSAALEGAITLAVIQALETIQPNFVRKPSGRRSFAVGSLAAAAVLLAAVGVVFASSQPDGIEKLTHYQPGAVEASWLGRAEAGLAGVTLIYMACLAIGRVVARRRSA